MLGENQIKHYRAKTTDERINEQASVNLDYVAQVHARLGVEHEAQDAALTKGEIPEYKQWQMDHFMTRYDEVIMKTAGETEESAAKAKTTGTGDLKKAAKATVTDAAKAKKDMASGEPTLTAQLSVAWMNRGVHFHLNGLLTSMAHKEWAPIFQGVSVIHLT